MDAWASSADLSVHYLYYLPVEGTVTGDTKRTKISAVLAWAWAELSIPADLSSALDRGVGGTRSGPWRIVSTRS